MRLMRLCSMAVAAVVVLGSVAGLAQQASDQRRILLEAEAALIDLRAVEPLSGKMDDAIARASAVLIVPELLKGAFIIGGEGGSGVLLARRADGSWSAPVFVTLGAASVGLQIGGQSSKVLFAVMNDKALDALLSDKVKLGVDLGVAVAHKGAGLEASTTTAANADVYQFAVSQGLFGGAALEGAVIEPRTNWNDAYYGRTLGPKAIVSDPNLTSPEADSLRAALGAR